MQEEKRSRRRLQTSYATLVISISLVLLLLGVMGVLVVNARKISVYVRENIGVSLILDDNVKEADIFKLQKSLETRPYVRTARYISKEAAAEDMKAELGEDFVQFIGYNPLPVSIELKLAAPYANNDSIRVIERSLAAVEQVREVWYQKNLIYLVNDNIRRISLVILGFAGLLMVVSFALINNTIRLMVYSRRFLINTMRLVGATNGFIRRPMIRACALHGLLGGLFALALLSGLVFVAGREFSSVGLVSDLAPLAAVYAAVLALGVLLSVVSSHMAVNKYLRLRTDQLY